MSPRVVIIITVVAALAVSAGVITRIVQPHPVAMSGAGEASAQPASAADRLEHRQRFFGGDATRDIRGGQEMKPRW
ncbi:Ti type entry exclusion protein TrbK [Rhizobium sp. BK226]|uniref:entry exclusion protein TrbK n=1 Tax=Rhizobium sp. BK226 TaxID=2587075 RepID=UPI00161C982F|nr:entry exclusion protein TrbK [Rhizobium sp. BK226]MBB4117019.1 Ti type entry exclusion protein TrbK [Rhizobium sp. BK226]